jgi:hypothetical protein
MKKNIIKSLMALSLVSFSGQALAWTKLATCGTGDALEGMDVFTDGENVIVQILSYEENDQGGATVANEYRTNNGTTNPTPINPLEIMEKLAHGETLPLVVTKEDSFSFGGLTNHAALLNIKLNPADENNENHYNRTTTVAFEGNVATFYCYLKND